jgi:hypothetical protein
MLTPFKAVSATNTLPVVPELAVRVPAFVLIVPPTTPVPMLPEPALIVRVGVASVLPALPFWIEPPVRPAVKLRAVVPVTVSALPALPRVMVPFALVMLNV